MNKHWCLNNKRQDRVRKRCTHPMNHSFRWICYQNQCAKLIWIILDTAVFDNIMTVKYVKETINSRNIKLPATCLELVTYIVMVCCCFCLFVCLFVWVFFCYHILWICYSYQCMHTFLLDQFCYSGGGNEESVLFIVYAKEVD
jgi:hypothetical protein